MKTFTAPLINTESVYERVRQFNPYKSPPDFELARLHAIASRVCDPREPMANQSGANVLKCPCCGLPVNNKQIPLCCTPEKFAHLGVCFPLYFNFIKFCFVVLGICLSIAGIVNLIINVMGTNCDKINNSSFICKTSFMNVLDKEAGVHPLGRQSVFNNLTIFVVIVALEFFRNYQRQFAYKHRLKHSVTDFALMLSFVPTNFGQDDIEDFINHYLKKLGRPTTKIVKIYFLHKLGEYADLYSKKKHLHTLKSRSPLKKQKLDTEISSINVQLRELENVYNTTDVPRSNRVIVILESCRAARVLQSHFRKSFMYKIATYCNIFFGLTLLEDKYAYNGHFIKVTKAPEPSDIKWENLGFQSRVKTTRRIMTGVVVVVLLILGFGLLLLLKLSLKRFQKAQDVNSDVGQYLSIVVSLLGASCVAITNTILGIYIRKMVRYEKHTTQTNFFVTVGRRITAALIVNMTFTTMLANFVVTVTAGSLVNYFKLSVSGLFYDVFFLFITNSYMSSIFNYFDIMWGVKLNKRRLALKAGPQSKMTQIEANTLFEGHPVDMALRFANVNKTLIFTGLFIPFIPLGIVFSMIGFVITYWVDKYLLLRRYVCANRLSYALPKAMLGTAEWFILAYAFGNVFIFFIPSTDGASLTLKGKLLNSYFYLASVTFMAAFIYKFFIPTNYIHNQFFKFKHRREEILYPSVEDHLPEKYDHHHPVYRRQGMEASEFRGGQLKLDFGVDDEMFQDVSLNTFPVKKDSDSKLMVIEEDNVIELNISSTQTDEKK